MNGSCSPPLGHGEIAVEPGCRAPHGRPSVLRRVVWLAALGLAFCPPQALAAEPPALSLTLKDAVQLALRNNRALVDARLRRVAERFALQVAENEFRPHVTVGPYLDLRSREPSTEIRTAGAFSKARLRLPTGGAFETGFRVAEEDRNTPSAGSYPGALQFTFTQPLLRGAGREAATAGVRIARVTERINILALKAALAGVVSAVVRSYRGYIQAERRTDIAAKSLERARGLLAINRLLVEAGRMAELDIVQAQADIARRELNLIRAQNRQDAARLALIDILDIDSGTRLGRMDSLEIAPAPLDMARGMETALERRPDYLGSQLAVMNAETRLAAADNNRLWDLSLTLSTSFARTEETFRSSLSGLDRTGHTARLELSIPLGPAASDPRKLAWVRARTDLKRARNNHADLRQRIDIEVRNGVREVELSFRQVELARTARRLVEQKAAIERDKLSRGLSTNFQLVAFEDDLVAARNGELEAVVGYLNALTALDRTLGTTLERWDIRVGPANP